GADTRDPKAAESFYEKLFGWTLEGNAPSAGVAYTHASVAGSEPFAGIFKMPPDMPAQVPSYWMPYFQVADAAASTTRAKDLGARAMMELHEVQGRGRFSILQDPQRAMFAVFEYTNAAR